MGAVAGRAGDPCQQNKEPLSREEAEALEPAR